MTNESALCSLLHKAPIADRALGIRILGTADLAQLNAAETAHVRDGLLLQSLAVTARVLELRCAIRTLLGVLELLHGDHLAELALWHVLAQVGHHGFQLGRLSPSPERCAYCS